MVTKKKHTKLRDTIAIFVFQARKTNVILVIMEVNRKNNRHSNQGLMVFVCESARPVKVAVIF